LPAELASFVGRGRELRELQRLVYASRLVTLTGVGGVGKTRLAVRAAATLEPSFADGVRMVELGTLTDSDLVAHAIAYSLGLQDRTSRPLLEVLTDSLVGTELLLLLDTADAHVDACARLAGRLLAAVPGLKIIATSRQALGVLGEQIMVVPPLMVDSPGRAGPAEATTLFAERAAAISGFVLTPENEPTVSAICRRLDGLPLAVEFAAARSRVLSVEQIAARLDDRFSLLSGRVGRVAARHRTMRTAIGWSHELCEPPERLLWTRLSVFPVDFDAAAVAGVCADDQLDAGGLFDVLARLVDKSVLLAEENPDGMRYRMLDTVRGYGREWLRACGDEELLRRRHREHYLALAQRFHAEWFGPRQAEWSRRVRTELPNLRAALRSGLSAAEDVQDSVRLAGALCYFWFACGAIQEGRYWLDQALAADPTPTLARVDALVAYCWVLIVQGEHTEAVRRGEEAVAHADTLGDPLAAAKAATQLGASLLAGNQLDQSQPVLEAAIAQFEALPVRHPFQAHAASTLAMTLLFRGDPARAASLNAESMAMCRELGDRHWLSHTLMIAARTATALGNLTQARENGWESIRLLRDLDDQFGIASALERLADLAVVGEDHREAAFLFGMAHRQWRLVGRVYFGAEQWVRRREASLARARQGLGDAAFDAEFERGAALRFTEASALLLPLHDRPH
jgi:predicted ATPase